MFRTGLVWGGSDCPLFDEEEEKGGGGDGSGNSNSGEDNTEGNASEGDKPITMAMLTELLTSLKGDITKQVNAIDKKLKQQTSAPPAGNTPKAPAKKPTQFEDEEKEELRTRLEQVERDRQTEREASLKKERDAEIKAALSEYTWKETDDRNVAFDYYKGKAERDEDGGLVIDGVELGEFIKKHVPKRFKGMLAPRDLGGSGNAGPGKSKAGGALDIKDINPAYLSDPANHAKVQETLATLYAASRAGQ
jgi:hypothetical protein